MKVYLDIDVGDFEAFDKAQKEHAVFLDFLSKKREMLGLDKSEVPGSFSEETLESLAAVWDGEPEWKSRGGDAMRHNPPPPIRAGRLIIELFQDHSPLAVDNFSKLCESREPGKTYRGSVLHRIIPGFMAQGGDYTRGDGMGGAPFKGGKSFKDDIGGLKLKHDARGVVSMANAGKNSNTSQFFITFAPTQNLDGKHVVFGKCDPGPETTAVLSRLEAVGTPEGGLVKGTKAVIADCGILK